MIRIGPTAPENFRMPIDRQHRISGPTTLTGIRFCFSFQTNLINDYELTMKLKKVMNLIGKFIRSGTAIIVCLIFLLSISVRGAGVTIITHGLDGNTDGWVRSMATAMQNYRRLAGAAFAFYEVYFSPSPGGYVVAQRKLAGSSPIDSDSGEIFIALDWRGLADGFSHDTYEVAANVAPVFLEPGFIPELDDRALTEFPLHLIGHSRGGSLVCEIARLLGKEGVWIDHVTTLDPHPLNNDEFSINPPYTAVDASAEIYENVFFADNFWQNLGIAHGEKILGSSNRKLLNLDGGYEPSFFLDISASHADTHLWYHGTIDLRIPATDTEATLTSHERVSWWSNYEENGYVAGFFYSLIGGGDRFSAVEPAGFNTGKISDGINRFWDFGLGTVGNRTPLSDRRGIWPNVIRFNLTGNSFLATTNAAGLVDQKFFVVDQADAVPAQIFFQYGGGASGSANLRVFLDADANPYNANQTDIHVRQLAATGTAQVGMTSLSAQLDPRTVASGRYFVGAEISAGGYRRYLYSPERLLVFPQFSISVTATVPLRLRVVGVNGWKVALEHTSDFKSWTRLPWQTLVGADNHALTGETSFSDADAVGVAAKFYRAVYVP
ncbi:MAG: hypothetical protein HY043_16800 [Verrucomicrobia bacterium]|nr:hypothetical protein [Verrucomicrobiota bacterium]